MFRTIQHYSIRLLILSAFLSTWGTGLLHAGLPDYVREDVGLCVHVREISMWVNELKNSEIRHRLEAVSFFQRWKESYDYRILKSTIQTLEQKLGDPPAEVLLSSLGREILLAVYPDAGDRPSGVFMTSPSDRKMAQKLIDFWNQSEQASITRVDDKYVHRTSNRGVELYYFLTDELFALSDQEELISELADLGATGFENSLSQSSRWKRAIDSLEKVNWTVAYFQPDSWKHYLSGEPRDSFEEALIRQIGRMECLVAGVEGRDGLHARLNLVYPAGMEPEKLQEYRERHSDRPTDWSGLSAQTILMAAGRGGPEFLAELIRQQAPRSRETLAVFEVARGLLLGRDPLKDVLPYLGRHWQYSITAQPDRAEFPWDLQFQLDFEVDANRNSTTAGEANSSRPDLHQSLQNLVRTAVRIGGLFLSPSTEPQPRIFSETLPGELTIDGFETQLGLSPSIGIGKEKMVIANSKSLVERAFRSQGEAAEPQQMSDRLARLANQCYLGFYLNLNALRASLSSHSDVLLRLQHMEEAQRTEATDRLSRQLEVFSLVDSAYLFGVISEDLVSFHFGIESLP